MKIVLGVFSEQI